MFIHQHPLIVMVLLSLSSVCGTSSSSSSSSSSSLSKSTMTQDTPVKEEEDNVVKTVYLIRHAESEENRRLGSLAQCFSDLGRFTLPSSNDISASVSLLNVAGQVDSDVSDLGQCQIKQLRGKLDRDDFLKTRQIQLVAHSPLKRARQTSLGMLGCMTPDDLAPGVGRVEELGSLTEKTPAEWLPGGTTALAERTAQFQTWLGEQPETNISIVGHSQYFKSMLGLDFKFGNCDVWQVKYDKNAPPKERISCTVLGKEYELPTGWSGLERLYTFDEEEKTNGNNKSI